MTSSIAAFESLDQRKDRKIRMFPSDRQPYCCFETVKFLIFRVLHPFVFLMRFSATDCYKIDLEALCLVISHGIVRICDKFLSFSYCNQKVLKLCSYNSILDQSRITISRELHNSSELLSSSFFIF